MANYATYHVNAQGQLLMDFSLEMALAPGMGEATEAAQLAKALVYWQGVVASASTTNLLTANQADVETDTTGFTQRNGATLTRDTTQHLTGAASLKVVCPAPVGPGGAHFFGAHVPVPSSLLVPRQKVKATFSLLGAAGGEQARILIWGDTPNTDFSPGTVTLTTSWQQFTVVARLPQNLAGNYGILVDTGPSPLAMTWYMDSMAFAGGETQPTQVALAAQAITWIQTELARLQNPPANTLHIVYPI